MHNQKLTLLTTFGAMLLVACGGSTSSSSAASSSSSAASSEFVIPSSEALPNLPLADGIFDYTTASFTEKGEMLGQLEKLHPPACWLVNMQENLLVFRHRV